MFGSPIALPVHLQSQSAFLCLPTEIQHIIYGFAFTAGDSIVDPRTSNHSVRLDSEVHPPLGIAVLQTCRRAYHEVDRRPLFTQNVFRFTTVDLMRSFLKQIDRMGDILDVELDFHRLNSDEPEITREWLRMSSSLSTEAPNLKCLRLNFESWPKIPLFRTSLWAFLQDLLSQIRGFGLERIIVVGASKGGGMARQLPWSPVHFVGGDNVGSNALVPRMAAAVAGPDDSKMVRWVREDGKLQLEVISEEHLRQHVDYAVPTQRQNPNDARTTSGSCAISEYQNSSSHEHVEKINPSAAE